MRPRPNPEWYPAIQHKLKTHIEYLVARYRISSHSIEDIFNEVVVNMVKAERNGSTIKFPLTYSKLAARNLVVRVQKDEYQERGMEIILQGHLYDEIHADTATSYDQSWEDCELLCNILGTFRQKYPRHHQFIVLRDLRELDYDRIADLLGISNDAARQGHCRAEKAFLNFTQRYVLNYLN